MEQWSANAEIDERQAVPRTDGWAKLALAVLSVSLAWTALVFLVATLSDPCASSGDQCVLAFVAMTAWVYPQAIAAPFQVVALVVLTRYAFRGNHRVTGVGLALFVANCALTALLYWYLTTLPSYFR